MLTRSHEDIDRRIAGIVNSFELERQHSTKKDIEMLRKFMYGEISEGDYYKHYGIKSQKI